MFQCGFIIDCKLLRLVSSSFAESPLLFCFSYSFLFTSPFLSLMITRACFWYHNYCFHARWNTKIKEFFSCTGSASSCIKSLKDSLNYSMPITQVSIEIKMMAWKNRHSSSREIHVGVWYRTYPKENWKLVEAFLWMKIALLSLKAK